MGTKNKRGKKEKGNRLVLRQYLGGEKYLIFFTICIELQDHTPRNGTYMSIPLVVTDSGKETLSGSILRQRGLL